ncbi:MAG: hypothetical protein ACRC8Q_14660 [Aeromonas sp.]
MTKKPAIAAGYARHGSVAPITSSAQHIRACDLFDKRLQPAQ